MRAAALQQALVDELRLGAGPLTMRELRLVLNCGAAELAGAIQALRYQGKLAWDAIQLSDSMKSAGTSPTAEGGGESNPASLFNAPPPPGPDDEDDEDYPGGVNDITEAPGGEGPAGDGTLPAESQAAHVPDPIRHDEPALPDGRVEEPRPDAAVDQPAGVELGRKSDATGHAPSAAAVGSGGFVPKALLHKAGVHAASTRAGARPLPVPVHESEVARAVREEVEELRDRRRRGSSTATVRQPLELKKFAVADMSLGEAIGSMLSDDPQSIMRAVSRKHPAMWRRCILLGRELGQSPMQTLYAALERGLDQLQLNTARG